ncbi:MAG: hypothetical protein M0R48_05010 [Candidatus Omnitrophica bacterium]|jgi:hypothetical protein|nr:hypothetical protein [Candidatus Omnitrophota bacterium]
MIEYLKANIEGVGILISVVSIAWTAVRYINLRSQEIKQKRFEVYHSLIKDFVQPEPSTGKTYLDRQVAIAFELRNFFEYYDLSLRLLEGIYNSWAENAKDTQRNRLLKEIQLTIDYIKRTEVDNPIRLNWFCIYLALGISTFFFFLVIGIFALPCLLNGYLQEILWCASWAAIGISSGLYNSRTESDGNSKKHKHYYTYFLFVWFVATLAGWTMIKDGDLRSYIVACLVGIVVGFTGDKLAGKIFELRK